MAGQLPLVRDTDPMELIAAPTSQETLQRYFPRDVDKDLDRALSTPGVVVVVHEAFSGARRAVYEALLRNLPTLPLWVTNSVTKADSESAPTRAVLWADLSTEPLSGVGEVAPSIIRWFTPGRYAVVLGRDDHPQLRAVRDALHHLDVAIVQVRGRLSSRERAAAKTLLNTDVRTVEELHSRLDDMPAVSADDAGDMPEILGRHAAGYHADTDTGDDQLGITVDVHMLADVVASRLVRPPLSIGLFGNWGTGKSFFMRQMRARVRELADAAAEEEARAELRGTEVSSYCSTVRQVTFNAWHYVEANLWASLATHIFDSLATGGSEDVLRRRADDLAELRRTEQSLLTQLSAVRLERRLVAAQQKRRVPLDLTGEDFAWVAQELGVPAATADDVRQFATEVGGLGVEARRVWTLLQRNRFAWSMVGVAVVLAVGLAVLVGSPAWPVVAGVVSVLVGVTPVVSRVREAAARIRRAAESTDQRLTELDQETERLERAVAELATGQDATAFAKARHADYRQHLGVVSLLRRDLETFAAILDKERDSDGGLERIVLYIDDLDRCPPAVVIKVLEAVHLLVALPVFVVVVAVDPRWLHQAIRHHYATMLPDESVTPTHYLEKIFQIPFQLSPMDEQGFGNLVWALSGTEHTEPERDSMIDMSRQVVEQRAWFDQPVVVPDESAPRQEPAAPLELRPLQLHISQEELDFLTGLAALVPTPRAAKRLINLYRLVRARLSDAELDEFVRGGDFRTVLTLLAGGSNPDEEARERWLPLVRRFSFEQRGTAPGAVAGDRS